MALIYPPAVPRGGQPARSCPGGNDQAGGFAGSDPVATRQGRTCGAMGLGQVRAECARPGISLQSIGETQNCARRPFPPGQRPSDPSPHDSDAVPIRHDVHRDHVDPVQGVGADRVMHGASINSRRGYRTRTRRCCEGMASRNALWWGSFRVFAPYSFFLVSASRLVATVSASSGPGALR